jgi:hypothetical protein
MSRPLLGPTELPVQWSRGYFPTVNLLGREGTTHLYLVQRLRMSGAILQLTLYPFMLWTGAIFNLALH